MDPWDAKIDANFFLQTHWNTDMGKPVKPGNLLKDIVNKNVKAKSNYRGYNRKSSNPNFFIHYFIDNSNANISLYA